MQRGRERQIDIDIEAGRERQTEGQAERYIK